MSLARCANLFATRILTMLLFIGCVVLLMVRVACLDGPGYAALPDRCPSGKQLACVRQTLAFPNNVAAFSTPDVLLRATPPSAAAVLERHARATLGLAVLRSAPDQAPAAAGIDSRLVRLRIVDQALGKADDLYVALYALQGDDSCSRVLVQMHAEARLGVENAAVLQQEVRKARDALAVAFRFEGDTGANCGADDERYWIG